MIYFMKLIGLFISCTGFVSLIQRNKKLKTYKKNKGNYNLGEIQEQTRLRKWPYILMMILGGILIFFSNFEANLSETKNGEKEVVWEGEISDENNGTEDESKEVSEDDPTIISENNTVENGQTTYTIRVGGYDLSIPIPEEWDTYAYDFLISTYPTNYSISLGYEDSFIDVGDMEALETEINSVEKYYNTSVVSGTFTQNGKTNYAFYWMYENVRVIQIYQDIGGETYLSIEIDDYNAQYDVEELMSTFCITIN